MKQTIFRINLGAHSLVPPARALRQLPRHVTLETPADWHDVFRATAWLVVRAVAMVGAVAILLTLAAGRHT